MKLITLILLKAVGFPATVEIGLRKISYALKKKTAFGPIYIGNDRKEDTATLSYIIDFVYQQVDSLGKMKVCGRRGFRSHYSCRGCLGWPGCHGHRSHLDSIKQIPSCRFYRADSIVPISLCRADSLVQALSCTMRVSLVDPMYRAGFILR